MKPAEADAWVIHAANGRPLTTNRARTMHHHAYGQRIAATRAQWRLLALGANIPPLDACMVIVTPLHKDHRSPQDCAAAAPEAKACIDGIVDAGVIPDDNAQHLLEVSFRPPRVCGVDGIELMVIRLDGMAGAA